MGQTRGSSYKFQLHGGTKQDLIKEMPFGNLGNIRVNIGLQRQRDELVVLFSLTPFLFCFSPFIPINYFHRPLSQKHILFEMAQYLSLNIYMHPYKTLSAILCIHIYNLNSIKLWHISDLYFFHSTMFLRSVLLYSTTSPFLLIVALYSTI